MGNFIGGGRQFGSNRIKHSAKCKLRGRVLQVEGESLRFLMIDKDGSEVSPAHKSIQGFAREDDYIS